MSKLSKDLAQSQQCNMPSIKTSGYVYSFAIQTDFTLVLAWASPLLLPHASQQSPRNVPVQYNNYFTSAELLEY
jgi:hypothetical protein